MLQDLRGALIGALTAVGVDPERPQEVARRLGLHRNLTWKVSKIVTGRDVFASVSHVLGRFRARVRERRPVGRQAVLAGHGAWFISQISKSPALIAATCRERAASSPSISVTTNGCVTCAKSRRRPPRFWRHSTSTPQVLRFTNALGGYSQSVPWPAGIPAGVPIYMQFLVPDLTMTPNTQDLHPGRR
ncbi:MAG: hypothetical protein DRQ55_13240 [Planctomycetota bacterium]|nr:MAG: hypothetical protein DRQ55_13240 [Planctomycetota bacterium]